LFIPFRGKKRDSIGKRDLPLFALCMALSGFLLGSLAEAVPGMKGSLTGALIGIAGQLVALIVALLTARGAGKSEPAVNSGGKSSLARVLIWFLPVTAAAAFVPDHIVRGVTALCSMGGICALYLTWSGMRTELTRAARQAERDSQLERVIDMQQKQYAALSEQIAVTRAARHDLRHHMSALWSFVEDGDREHLREYLEVYGGSLRTEGQLSICSNFAVDSVVQHYLDLAKKYGADIDVSIDINEDMGIDTPDLCVVFGNILENAAEAVKNAPKELRYIRVRTENAPHWLTIVVGNGFRGTISRSEGGYLSSKSEGRMGVGLKSVESVAEKYHGAAEYTADGEVFKASVILFKRDE
ncbi:MAG: sensor histidine kinase, partial [Oscillospiraceae bacterium]|nr:sensor histidine kinase [Oscillospiraceae bacterium]